MEQVDPLDYRTRLAWLGLQQDLVWVAPNEASVEIDTSSEDGFAPYQLIIKMNDSRDRVLEVTSIVSELIVRADVFLLFDGRLKRWRKADQTELLDVCKSWMNGTQNMKRWNK